MKGTARPSPASKMWGVLEMDSSGTHDFGKDECNVLAPLANMLGAYFR